MSAIPGGIDTSRQPSMGIPLRHFLVGLAFLIVAGFAGVGSLFAGAPARLLTVQLHLLLVGWVCVTIMGAMTQFVPVWGGVSLHSERLARWQLWLLVGGLLGFGSSLFVGDVTYIGGFALVMLAGFWLFIYNVGRTILTAGFSDRTLRHFSYALGFFFLVTWLGVLLAFDMLHPFLVDLGLSRSAVREAHLTFAVFGGVLTTIMGALYQIGTMFTQTSLTSLDGRLATIEEVVYPTGTAALGFGWLFDVHLLGLLGGIALVSGVASFTIVIARKLWAMRVPWTPMHRRYVIVVLAAIGWIAVTLPAWTTAPLSYDTRFGGPGGIHLLGGGVIMFVIIGTLYHIIPFIIWVHRYSELLGYEPVPMVDDLYHTRVAHVEFILLVTGTILMVGWELFALSITVVAVGTGLVGIGIALFVANMVWVVGRHNLVREDGSRSVFGKHRESPEHQSEGE